MRIAIHTGASGLFGLGHATRMRALAAALAAQGASVSFLTPTPELGEVVSSFPCAAFVPDMGPEALPCDVFVEDVPPLYTSPSWWYAMLRQHRRVVRVDVPTATPSTCDLLLAPCAHWAPETVTALRTAFGSRFLFGWDYVLLDDAVTQFARTPYAARVDGPVVLCAGGSDPGGALLQMASWMGAAVKQEDWVALVPRYGGPVSLPVWVRTEPFSRAWLRRASLLLTTWGVTVYEGIWWGVPMLTVTSTDRTEADARRLETVSHNAATHLGHVETISAETMGTEIARVVAHPALRAQMAAVAAGLLDGFGAHRAATAILALEN